MEADPFKEEQGVEVSSTPIHHRHVKHIRHLLEHIHLQAGLIHHLQGVEAVPEEQQVEEVAQEVAGVEEDNKMKKYLLPTAFMVLMITLTGCYTATWNPGDNDFPTKDKYLEAGNSLYAQSGYDFYDNSPWWWEIDPPVFNDNDTDNGYQNLESTTITIIDYGPSTPFIPPPLVGIPVQPPVITPSPAKPVNNSNDKEQNVRPRDNTNNSSNKTRNDNGSRNTDNRRNR